MTTALPFILTINGGSSSIKYAPFEADNSLQRILEGVIKRVGPAHLVSSASAIRR